MPELADYSEVGIANLALRMIGRGAIINALTDDNQAARVMRLALPYARDATIRSFPWNFAKARASITSTGVAPAFEFSHAYDLPSDPTYCLRVMRVDGLDSQDWRVEGRQILCNDSGPLKIKFLKRVTDFTQTDPLFVSALATRLAAETATSLSESAAKASDLLRAYQLKLREARAVNSQEGQPDDFPLGDWNDARFMGIVQPYRDWSGV